MTPNPQNVRKPWEDDFWTPDQRWQGETAFVLASGPSLAEVDVEQLRGRHVIVVNGSWRRAPWAEVLFFTDTGWFEQNREVVTTWPGTVVTLSRGTKRELNKAVHRVRGEWSDGFPAPGSRVIRQGRSSGQTAISVARSFAASRIVLLGFDMRLVGGAEHHHADYTDQARDLSVYERDFLPAFAGWRADADQAGFEILNATPGSAITEFRFVELSEVL